MFLDNTLIDSNLTNFDVVSALTVTNIAVASGMHTLNWVTYEDCCDGPQDTGQFRAPGATSYTLFSTSDGLVAPVAIPEPASFAILALGVISLGGIETRRWFLRREVDRLS